MIFAHCSCILYGFMSSNKPYKKITSCRICKSKKLSRFLKLGPQPLANAFLKKRDLKKKELFVPLDAYFCHTCGLAQLGHVVDKEVLYRDYLYFTSGMPKISGHFSKYARHVMSSYLKKGDLVVEIASNDGILLNFFKKYGYKVLGIEPALNIVKVARKLGVETVPKFFSAPLAKALAKKYGKAKVIMANNVVAHINDHHDLAKGICEFLAPDGIFALEAPYLVDMFENLTFDTIYHEHLSFLALRPLQYLFNQYDMEIIDVQIVPVQGISFRVFVAHKGAHRVKKIVGELLKKEQDLAMNKLRSYQQLAKRVEKSKEKLLNTLKKIKKEGKTIAGYGAPAKGNTLLNYYGINTNFLNWALEHLPSKHGLYTPGTHIPVVDDAYAKANPPNYYLMLAWNYKEPILAREKTFRKKGGKFIIPVGDEIEII